MKATRAEMQLGLLDSEIEKSYGRNADLRATHMDADLVLLVAALQGDKEGFEVDAFHTARWPSASERRRKR